MWKDFSQYMVPAILEFILQASLTLILETSFPFFEAKFLDFVVSLSVGLMIVNTFEKHHIIFHKRIGNKSD